MRREELTEKLSAFEGKHPVSRWTWQGWRIWPVVRTRLALALHGGGAPAGAGARPGPGRLSRSLAWRRQRLRRWLGERLAPSADAPADAVFLTGSDRAQRLDRRFYNTVVDPWAEAFAAEGRRVSVWSLGDPRRPSHVPHVPIQRAIDRAGAQRAAQPMGAAPDWFGDLAAWAAEALDVRLAWPRLGADLRAVVTASTVLEPWLRRARPRALVLDCWYRKEALGAALAARRLGIPVIDLQHGVQGEAHPCYAGWTPPIGGRYEAFPDRFWVWGRRDAASLVACNPGTIGPEDVEVMGNRWLCDWVERDDPRRRPAQRAAARLVGGRHAVLVTLQEGVAIREALEPLMRAAPRDWLWLVRLHRRSAGSPRRLQRELAAATGRRVESVRATRLPLYAWLRVCAWHVTAFSTCAQEALAFGVPTLLLHESGVRAFAEAVARCVMRRHDSVERSVEWLSERSETLAEACRVEARQAFGGLAGGGSPGAPGGATPPTSS